eukprot:bmy_11583T0
MYYDFFPDNFNPNGYWGNYGYSLGHCTDCGYVKTSTQVPTGAVVANPWATGYGSSYSSMGYGFGCRYGSSRPLDYRRYWTFDLY